MCSKFHIRENILILGISNAFAKILIVHVFNGLNF